MKAKSSVQSPQYSFRPNRCFERGSGQCGTGFRCQPAAHNDNGQAGYRADNNGVNKGTEHGDQPLTDRVLGFAAACAIGALPRPASLENTPRATPKRIAAQTVAPQTRPVPPPV